MSILTIIQIIIAVLLTSVILFQQRGAGGSAIFGEGGGGASYFRKRGMEKTLAWATIILATIFLTLSLIRMKIG